MVQFNNIPANIRVPLFYAEINPAQAPYQSNSRLLLVGQKLTAGSATAREPILVTGSEDGLFGPDSMLAIMYKKARLNAPIQEIWALPIADPVAGTVATGKIAVTGTFPVTQNTSLVFYIHGVRFRVTVKTTDTAASVATAIAAAINASVEPCLVTAAVNGTVTTEVDVTTRHKGAIMNKVRIEHSLSPDDPPAAKLLLTITQPAGGAGNPSLATELANLGAEEFDWIAGPYSDTADLDDMGLILDATSGRWSPYQQLYGHYITHRDGTVGELTAHGLLRNDPHVSIMGSTNAVSPPWEWAAALGAQAVVHLQEAPELSRPLQTLPLIGIRGPKLSADRFDISERQTLYYAGISGFTVNRDGSVAIDRVVTTYQRNAYGSPDPSWLDINTIAQLVYGIRYLKAKITGQWGRAALADDNPTGIQGLATARDVRTTIVHGYRELVSLGVYENEDVFNALLIVERAQNDANRLDIYLPLDSVNQLRIIAVNATSFLQFSQ